MLAQVAGQFASYFFHEKEPVALHHKIRRDYPLDGDSACAIYEDDELAQTAIFVLRPEAESIVSLVVVIQVLEDRFATWATFQSPGSSEMHSFSWPLEGFKGS